MAKKKENPTDEIINLLFQLVNKEHDKPSPNTKEFMQDIDKRLSLFEQKSNLTFDKIDKFIENAEKSFSRKWVEKVFLWFSGISGGVIVIGLVVFLIKGIAENIK